jgi:hypothetical protein
VVEPGKLSQTGAYPWARAMVRRLRAAARRSASTGVALRWLPAAAADSCSNGVEGGEVRCGAVEQRGWRGWSSPKWRKAATASSKMR